MASTIDIVNAIWANWDDTIPGIVANPSGYANNQRLLEEFYARKDAEEAARRKAEADAFNRGVNDYNSRASDLFNRTNAFANQIAGYNIANVNDRSEYGSLNNFANELSGLTFTAQRPSFAPTYYVSNDAGQAFARDAAMPSLASADNSYSARASAALNNARSTLDRLYTDRANEEGRISSFFSGFERDLGQAADRANQINFADMQGMQAGRAAQADLQGRLGGFSSLLNPDTSALRSSLGAFETRLNELYNQRSAEENRINDFRSGISSAFAPVRDATQNLTIRDIDQIVGSQNKLNELSSSLNSFSSLLNPNFSEEMNGIETTASRLSNLLGQREAEQNRINNTAKDFFSRSSGLTNEANNSGIYSKSALDSLKGKVGGLQNEIGSFSSLLDYNFGDANNYLAEAGKRISELYSQRANTLNSIGSTASQAAAGVADVPLYQEDDFNARKGTISQQIASLNNFSGEDVAPVQQQAEAALGSVANRLNELYGYRNNLEGRAQSYLGDLNNKSFYNSQTVLDAMGDNSPYAALRKEIDLYKAAQAGDEIGSIGNRYNAELARLLLDEKRRSERDAAEAQAIKGRNTKSVPLYSKGIPLTEEEYRAFISGRRRQQDELQNQQARTSSFARALGVVG